MLTWVHFFSRELSVKPTKASNAKSPAILAQHVAGLSQRPFLGVDMSTTLVVMGTTKVVMCTTPGYST
jgi:hypothetical protein